MNEAERGSRAAEQKCVPQRLGKETSIIETDGGTIQSESSEETGIKNAVRRRVPTVMKPRTADALYKLLYEDSSILLQL